MRQSQTRSALLQRAMAGDQPALAALLTDAEDALRRRMTGRIPFGARGVLDCDDLLQEVYTEAFRSISRFESHAPDSFERWLATIALRCLRREIRHLRAAKRGGEWARIRHVANAGDSTVTLLRLIEASDSSPSRKAVGSEEREALHAALEALPTTYAAAVRLVYIEGCTVAQAAQQLKLSEGTVRSLCYRAKIALREALQAAHASRTHGGDVGHAGERD